MKAIFKPIALSVVFCALCLPAGAEENATTSKDANTTVPEVKSTGKDNGGKQFEMMGNQDFFLAVDPKEGTMDYAFDPQTNNLERMVARKGVVLSNMEMALNCDQLDYDNSKAEVVATGRRVLLRQGDIIASCQYLTYNTNTQDSVLKGKPTIYMRTEKGVVTQTGDVVTIRRVNGKPTVSVRGSGQLYNNANNAATKGAAVTNMQKNPASAVPKTDAATADSGASVPVVQKSKDGNAQGIGKALGIAAEPQGMR